MRSVSVRSLGKRQLVVLMAAVLAFAGLIAVKSDHSAFAASKTVSLDLSCSTNLGITVTATAGITTFATPDPGVAGAPVDLTIQPSAPKLSLTVNINSIVITTPIPAQVSPASITTSFVNGATPANFTGSSAVSGTNLVLTFTGAGVSSDSAVLPNVIVHSTINAGTAGQTLSLGAPTLITSDTTLGGNAVSATCAPTASSPTELNSFVIAAPVVTTVPTTAPPTTKPPTTLPPTTKPPTTTAPKSIWQQLLCFFFHIC